MVQITVPEDIGGELRVLPEDNYVAVLKGFTLKMSKSSNQPMLIGRYIIKSEFSGKKTKDYVSTIGETVLEIYSLQANAIFNLNNLYKEITGDRLPQGDFSEQEFTEMVNNACAGTEVNIDVYTEPPNAYHDDERSKIRTLVKA